MTEEQRLTWELKELLARAAATLGELNGAREAWAGPLPVTVSSQTDEATGVMTFYANDVGRPPPILSILVAEVAHGCRLVVDLIGSHRRRIPPPPSYPLVGDPFQAIVDLDNAAKHEMLPVVVLAISPGTVFFMERGQTEPVDHAAMEGLRDARQSGDLIGTVVVPAAFMTDRHYAASVTEHSLRLGRIPRRPDLEGADLVTLLGTGLKQVLGLVGEVERQAGSAAG